MRREPEPSISLKAEETDALDWSPFGFTVPSRVTHTLVLLVFCQMYVVLKFVGAIIVTVIDVVIIISKNLFLVCFIYLFLRK